LRDPIFIIGTERSGTNLLRLILNAHSAIAVPHPPHIMKLFHPIERIYGNPDNDKNFKKLIGDVCRLVELHPYPWEIKPDKDQVFINVRERNLINIYFEIYNQYLTFTGKARWACKSTFMIEHVTEILKYFPEARFIYLVRDGRDVAISAKTSIFNHYHVYYTAQLWRREQQLGLSWVNKFPSGQIMLIKYEDLIGDTEDIIKKTCSFLEEVFEEKMLEYYNSIEAKKSGSLSISWKNTSKPVITGNKEKFVKNLSKRELKIFEAIAYNELRALGYGLLFEKNELEQNHYRFMKPRPGYWVAEKFLFLKTEVIHLFKDRNSLLRLKKIWFMRYLRIARRFL
jgi:hypothetical protein